MNHYRLRGSRRCTMNGGQVECGIDAESMEKAFLKFHLIFPGAGEAQCLSESKISKNQA